MLDVETLAAIPEPTLPRPDAVARGVEDSVAYLGSDEARRSLELDPYWPKWHSPWWHMLLLHELGEAARIPAAIAEAMAARIDGLLHVFPIQPDEAQGVDLERDIVCHCALGSMVTVLAACGTDVDRALPWARPWFVRYQMADGGLNCDAAAYLVTGECPSSMVGTVPPLEAMLLGDGGSPEDRAFVDRAGRFLLDRALVRGSATVHNAEERTSALVWGEVAFPRFYLYDVLRGLALLVRWARRTSQALPSAVVEPVVAGLVAHAPDGVVRIARDALAGRMTYLPAADGSSAGRVPATSFPLLQAVSVIGAPSEALTRQWSEVRAGLRELARAGQLSP